MSAFAAVSRISLHLVLGGILTAAASTTAFAQLSRATGSVPALTPGGTMRGTDTAYDPAHDVFLVVVGNGPDVRRLREQRRHPDLDSVRGHGRQPGMGTFSPVEYSRDVNNGAGGFLVSWHHNIGSLNYVFARIVSFDMPGFLVSGIQQISDGEQGGSWWETGPAMAYSTTSRKFLLAWRTIAYGIRGRFVDTNGSPFGGVMQFENPGGSRDPALAWNAATDEFGLISTGWSSTSALAAFRRIRASDGFISGRTSFGFSAGTFASAIDVNSANQYVLAWALHPGTMSAVFDQNGTQLTSNFVTGRIGHDQSLGMAYNPNSGTFLAVGSDGTSLELAAAEMKSDGEPNTLAQIITDGAKHGSNYPMVSARTNTSQWNVAYERDFGGAVTQFIATSTTGGGSPSAPPAPTPTPTPAPTPGPTLGCTTPDPFASIGGGTCVSGGWVPGRSGGGTPGLRLPVAARAQRRRRMDVRERRLAAPGDGWHGRNRRMHDSRSLLGDWRRNLHRRRLGARADRRRVRPADARPSRQHQGGRA